MIYFTKRPKKITKIAQVKEMLADATIEAYDELRKLELTAEMVYTKEYDLALEVLKHVNFKEIVDGDLEYYYEVALSVYASLFMIDEFISILDGYSTLNKTVAIEILTEFYINNNHIIEDKTILENFANTHIEDGDFKDYITMISKYHMNDLSAIREITSRNIGRVVEIDIFHQKIYYELAVIAFEEIEDYKTANLLKDDLLKFDKSFHSKINRLQVAKVPFNELVAFRKEKAMRKKKGSKELIVWTIVFILVGLFFFL